MKEQTKYQIQPEILEFMRKSSGMTKDEVAKKLKLPKPKYKSIEGGEEPISQNDLVHLADIYKRPLIAFYSAEVTKVSEMPHDYRLNRDKKLSPEVFFAKRKALYLAEQLKEITGKKTTLPEINTNISAVELAEKMRNTLEISASAGVLSSSEAQPIHS